MNELTPEDIDKLAKEYEGNHHVQAQLAGMRVSRKLRLHADFKRWQDAVTMNVLFGWGYIIVPFIPREYLEFGECWYRSTVWPTKSYLRPWEEIPTL